MGFSATVTISGAPRQTDAMASAATVTSQASPLSILLPMAVLPILVLSRASAESALRPGLCRPDTAHVSHRNRTAAGSSIQSNGGEKPRRQMLARLPHQLHRQRRRAIFCAYTSPLLVAELLLVE